MPVVLKCIWKTIGHCPVDDDMEEFVPVDEALAEKLIEIIENSDFDDEEFEDEE